MPETVVSLIFVREWIVLAWVSDTGALDAHAAATTHATMFSLKSRKESLFLSHKSDLYRKSPELSSTSCFSLLFLVSAYRPP